MKNKSNNATNSASIGKYSEQNIYSNISPMKHDIFKQIVIDISVSVVSGLIITYTDKDVFGTLFDKSLLSGIGYLIYYQIVQPYLVNYMPYF